MTETSADFGVGTFRRVVRCYWRHDVSLGTRLTSRSDRAKSASGRVADNKCTGRALPNAPFAKLEMLAAKRP